MMVTVLKFLGALFGIGNGGSVVNTAGGIVNNLTLLPVFIWLVAHAQDQLSFSTSYSFLALVVGVAYLLLEILRRSRPHDGG